MEVIGLEPMTLCLQSTCTTSCAIPPLYSIQIYRYSYIVYKERIGFEPTIRVYTSLANQRYRPLSHLSNLFISFIYFIYYLRIVRRYFFLFGFCFNLFHKVDRFFKIPFIAADAAK